MHTITELYVDSYDTLADVYSFLICDSHIDARLINEFGYLGRWHNHTANRSSANTYGAHRNRIYCVARAFFVLIQAMNLDLVFARIAWLCVCVTNALWFCAGECGLISSRKRECHSMYKCSKRCVCVLRCCVIYTHFLYSCWNQLTNVLHSLNVFDMFSNTDSPLPLPLSSEQNLKKRIRFESIVRSIQWKCSHVIPCDPNELILRTAYEVSVKLSRANAIVFQFFWWRRSGSDDDARDKRIFKCLSAHRWPVLFGPFILMSLPKYNFPQ